MCGVLVVCMIETMLERLGFGFSFVLFEYLGEVLSVAKERAGLCFTSSWAVYAACAFEPEHG